MKTITSVPRCLASALWLALNASVPLAWSHAARVDETWRFDCGRLPTLGDVFTSELLSPLTDRAEACAEPWLAEMPWLPGLTATDLESIDGPTLIPFAAESGRQLARQAVDAVVNAVLAPSGVVPAPPAAVRTSVAAADVARTLDVWSRAWSARDTEAYLAHYSTDFSTGEADFSMARWREQRRHRLLKAPWISVKVRELRVDLQAGDVALAHFVQDYRSHAFAESSRKVIALRRHGDVWRIISEREKP